jgi:hypothetical protein
LAAANPKGVLIDNPQASCQWLSFQKLQDAGQYSHDVPAALMAQPQHDQSWILVGRVRSDVGEAHIQRQQCPALQTANPCQILVPFSS